jgi:hypothetical protein
MRRSGVTLRSRRLSLGRSRVVLQTSSGDTSGELADEADRPCDDAGEPAHAAEVQRDAPNVTRDAAAVRPPDHVSGVNVR